MTLVLAISASGGTERVVQSIERARELGATTVAVTGNPEGKTAAAADRVLDVSIPAFPPSPGIRSYQASLLGLLLLAIRLAEGKDRLHQDEANDLRREIKALSAPIGETVINCREPARQAADAFGDAPAEMWLGSGPSYGTALFSAAKVVEAAGRFAIGQDLEEWAHVERFAYPLDMPVFLIAPDGRSHWRAELLAKQLSDLGRRLVAVTAAGDAAINTTATQSFPIAGEVREEFSPLLYHIPSNYYASYVADVLARKPFQSDLAS